jgi:hypothetical protein
MVVACSSCSNRHGRGIQPHRDSDAQIPQVPALDEQRRHAATHLALFIDGDDGFA